MERKHTPRYTIMPSNNYMRYFTLLIIIGLIVPVRIEATEPSFLKAYRGAYNITYPKDFPIAGSCAIMFQLKSNFPHKEIIEYYKELFESSGFQNFMDLGATREWRTYHKYYKDQKYRTKEYVASWWDTNNNYLYSLLLRYSTPSEEKNDTTDLSVAIQKVPLSKEDYKKLLREFEQLNK